MDQLETRIIEAIAEARRITHKDWYPLIGLREDLAAWYRKDQKTMVDDALIKLAIAGIIILVPESNQKTLTDAERAAAVNMGNQDKHLVRLP